MRPTVKTWFSVLGIAVCLFFGFWAFVLEGYQEDAGSEPVRSWPVGALLYGIAVVIAFRMLGRSRGPFSVGQSVVTIVALIAFAVLAALLSLDAGGRSFEF